MRIFVAIESPPRRESPHELDGEQPKACRFKNTHNAVPSHIKATIQSLAHSEKVIRDSRNLLDKVSTKDKILQPAALAPAPHPFKTGYWPRNEQ
jgi:hypothetical protein